MGQSDDKPTGETELTDDDGMSLERMRIYRLYDVN